MPIQIQDVHDQDESPDCPLCMEPFEVDDINFFPCECGYQICRFCWHRIRTDENGLCPACRKTYPENPAEFKPLSDQELQKIRLEKKQKEVARKQKITDGRKHLANVRVLQKNLVFVVGLSPRLADVEILKRQEYFGKYGKILKVVLNSNTSYAGTQTPSCSAYVTYSKMEESLRAIQSVNNVHIDGRTLKASLGTTKYCSNYLKNQQCSKHDCMYLHEIGDEEASFTKEDMQMAKHQEYEQKLIQQMIQKEISAAEQEMRNREFWDEDEENGQASAGSSPPGGTGIVIDGLSVAQAVKKNVKGNAASVSRPRRHSSSTPPYTMPGIGDGTTGGDDIDQQGGKSNFGKTPRLCTSVGDREPGASKTERAKGGTRRGKKNTNASATNQAPRHKKQQQSGIKKIPNRAHSASPSTQTTQSNSGSEQSPSSIPLSAGTSAESSPSVTPLRDDTGVSNSQQTDSDRAKNLPDLIGSTKSKISLTFSNERKSSTEYDSSESTERRKTMPIDIPTSPDASEEGKHRVTPHSDSGSSMERRSPFVREVSSREELQTVDVIQASVDVSERSQGFLMKSRFMMLHKEMESTHSNFPTQVSSTNGLGFSPFGTASDAITTSLLQDVQQSEERTSQPPPAPGLLPPGLSAFPPANTMTGWPTSNPKMPDTMPIKSTNDWEVAFGFKSVAKAPVSTNDDDLGFDPFLECSKGLADLLAKESKQDSGSGEFMTQVPPAQSPMSYFQPNNASHSSTTFSDMSVLQGRHATLPDHLRNLSQYNFANESSLVNGFSNLLSNASQVPQHEQHSKLPFSYESHHQQQLERSRFHQAQQQRLAQFSSRNTMPPRGLEHLFGSNMGPNKPQGVLDSTGPRDQEIIQKEWQNGLRALLPSVNINFATQGIRPQQPSPGVNESSLGLSDLGISRGNMNKMSSISHPPGLSNPMGQPPFLSKQHVPPPPGVGMGVRSNLFPSRQWSAPEATSFSTPNPSSSRLIGPSRLQMLFAGGGRRSEPNSNHNHMPSYPPDPAIISGGERAYASTGTRQSRLFENPQSRSSNGMVNSNNNSNDDQPHWMRSLQALTELESPMSAPEPSLGNPALSALFSQRQSGVPSHWPPMSHGGGGGPGGLFSAPGFGPSQPPPGFQVRPSISKPTEFGMPHNLLENQS